MKKPYQGVTIVTSGPNPHGHLTFEDQKTIDWNDSSDRKWLMNHLHWAVNNKRWLQIYPRDIRSSN